MLQEEAKELKEVNPCLKEWPDGEDDVCFAWTGSGPYSSTLSAGSLPIKIISGAECREDEPTAYYKSLLFLLRKVAFILLKGY